jgi:hypothetical protein
LQIEADGIIEERKPAGKWCPHCNPGRGCSRYSERPKVCATYECQWLADETVPEHWQPLKSHMVMSSDAAKRIVYIDVDPRHPDAWKREPYYSELKNIARSARVSIKCGSTHILLDDRHPKPTTPNYPASPALAESP